MSHMDLSFTGSALWDFIDFGGIVEDISTTETRFADVSASA